MDVVETVARAIADACHADYDRKDIKMAFDGYARAAIEAMRPEFEKLSQAYSPIGDDTVWIDDRTPIGLYVDSIINALSLSEKPKADV